MKLRDTKSLSRWLPVVGPRGPEEVNREKREIEIVDIAQSTNIYPTLNSRYDDIDKTMRNNDEFFGASRRFECLPVTNTTCRV